MEKPDNTDRRITKMGIHAIQVGCDNCCGPHLTKDCDLKKKGIKVFYSSGDKFDEYWRKPKNEWFPYDEYKKEKEEKYRQTGRGYYKKEQPPPKTKAQF